MTVSLDFIEANTAAAVPFAYVVGADTKIVIVVCKADKEEILRFVKRSLTFQVQFGELNNLTLFQQQVSQTGLYGFGEAIH